jgi:hypothetical protein
MKIDEDGVIRLSVMRALWGEIFPETRAVICSVHPGDILFIEFYIDGEVSNEVIESASCVEAEVTSDLYDRYSVEHEIIRLDTVNKIPMLDKLVIFLRRE